MNISELILYRIETDKVFRRELAVKIDLSERQVQNLVENHRQGKSVRLRDSFAVDFYKSKGYNKKQIFSN
ncbi:hypothetical protein CEY12_05995 [Chryseobacterium sp. T16E-39]|nr:hypothetical protein CEY12_05995 [Chryseobacterium sp. T16E-39]